MIDRYHQLLLSAAETVMKETGESITKRLTYYSNISEELQKSQRETIPYTATPGYD
jgi:hypothetical protein